MGFQSLLQNLDFFSDEPKVSGGGYRSGGGGEGWIQWKALEGGRVCEKRCTKAVSAARQGAGEKVEDAKLKRRWDKRKPVDGLTSNYHRLWVQNNKQKNNLFLSCVLSASSYELDKNNGAGTQRTLVEINRVCRRFLFFPLCCCAQPTEEASWLIQIKTRH